MNKAFIPFLMTALLLFGIPKWASAVLKYVKPVASGTGDGSSWANASGDLQAMIDSLPGAYDQIWLAKGTYKPKYNPGGTGDPRDNSFFQKDKEIFFYGGFNGTETSPDQRLPGLTTILSGDIGAPFDQSDNCFHVFILFSSGTILLDQIQVEGGNANGGGNISYQEILIPRNFGGGLYVNHRDVSYRTTLVLEKAAFVGNSASKGSAIYEARIGGEVSFQFGNLVFNTIFMNNTADQGGATWFNPLYQYYQIDFCTFFNNSGGSLYFGEIQNNSMVINNCVFSQKNGNTPDIVLGQIDNTINVRKCIFRKGAVYPGNGNIGIDDFQFRNPTDPFGQDLVLGTADDGLRHHPDFEGVNIGYNFFALLSNSDITGNPRPEQSKMDAGAYETSIPAFKIWYVKQGSTGKGSSWADASGDLNQIIDTACGKSKDQIWVAQGTYKPSKSPVSDDNDSRNYCFKLRNNVAMYGGFAGTESSLAQRPAEQKSILSGDIGVQGNKSDNCYHVVVSVSDSNSTRLDGFQIMNGNGNGSGTATIERVPVKKGQGGGINLASSDMTIQNTIITLCEASYGGGAQLDGGSKVVFTNVEFKQNKATNDGGGLFNSSAYPTLDKCLFLNDTAVGQGGAMANSIAFNTLVRVNNTVFSQNTAQRAAGIFNYRTLLYINNSVFINNHASVEGGGIVTENLFNTQLDISNSTFLNNLANGGGNGKGKSILSSGILVNKISNSIFWGSATNQLQNSDGSPLSGVSYSIIEGALLAGTGNKNQDPLFINSSDSDGADDVLGTFDDGLRISKESPAANASQPESNYTATDISGYCRSGVFDIGAYESFAAKPTIRIGGKFISEGSAEPEDLGIGQSIDSILAIQNTNNTPLTIHSIRSSGSDSASFQITGITFPHILNPGAYVFPVLSFTRTTPGNKLTSILLKSYSCDTSVFKFNVRASEQPFIGVYENKSLQSGGNSIVVPMAPPQYFSHFSAYASPGFKGILLADSLTGNIRVINANPVGTFLVTLKANIGIHITTKTFSITVTKPNCSSAEFVNAGNYNENNRITESVVGDFNDDGKQDLASSVSSLGAGFVSVRTGDGNGSFGTAFQFEVGGSPKTLVTADFNRDGKLDIATAGGSDFVSIRMGDGNAGFSGTTEIPSTNPQRMATGDFNGDGFVDLVVTNGNQNRVQILLGDGNGDFSEADFAGVGLTPNDVVVSDFNNDGKADLAVSLGFGSGTSILLGNGLGQFPTRTDITNTAESNSVSVIDFNNDGKMDWVNTNFLNNSLTVHLGNGLGGSMASFEVLVSGNAYQATAGDFNGDGFADIASLRFVDNTIEILTGDGTGNFTTTSPLLSVPVNSSRLATADFNGDGVTDLVCSSNSSTLLLGKKGRLSVFGKGVKIEEGDNTPSVSDNTDLGSVPIGQTTSKVFHIINTGTDQTTINEIRLGGSVSDMTSFSLASNALPKVLQIGDTLFLTVHFQPQSPTGQKTAFVEIVQNGCGQPFKFHVSGTALTGGPVAAVVVSPGTGTYSGPQLVTLSCATQGATILYTLTGNTPVIGTGFTKVYSGPFMVNNTTNVKAIATKSGFANSAVTSFVLTISNPTVVANPVITPGTGNYVGNQLVTITSATSDALIYYTTTGNTPVVGTGFTRLYTGPFLLNASANIKAIGIKSGFTSSAIISVFLTITPSAPVVATPVISPATGIYIGNQTVSISCATPGATIYYTTSGNIPVLGTGFTKVYTGSFGVNKSTTVRAMATLSGSTNSAIAVSFITITAGIVPNPLSISPEPGNFQEAQMVALTYGDPTVTLYYTLDGTEPDPNSPNTFVYSGPFMLSSSATIVAIAMKNNQLQGLLEPSVYQIGTVTTNEEVRQKSSVTVYPNPSSTGIFRIALGNEDISGSSFEILATDGRIIQTGIIEKSLNEINLSAFPTGVYVLKIRNEQKIELHRLVRQ